MITRYHIPAIAFMFFTSTVALFAQKSVYTFPFENSYKLPPMETYINAKEIASTYQTLGNLLGIPFATSITDVEVEASFFNETDHFITTHRGVGQGKKLIGLYSLSTRLPHQRALKKALNDLNTNIMADPKLQQLTLPVPVP